MDSQPLLISIIADYGTADPSFAEVSQRLLMMLPHARIQCLSVPAFSTLATGFWVAQLGLNPGPQNHLIYHNCAPRKDDPEARQDNEGEGLSYAKLPNGVTIVGVNAGYTLSFIKDHATALHTLNIARGGSQFRSRDLFPEAVAAIAQDNLDLLGHALNPADLPDVPEERVVWIDGYGNLKTTIPVHAVEFEPESKVVAKIGDRVSGAVYSDGSFKVPEGNLAFSPGSSGWPSPDGTPIRWMELFFRGGSAWERLGNPEIGDKLILKSGKKESSSGGTEEKSDP
ncbi:SAM hydrolase/SAM-dependent halogenase family protein [Vacuolonema iberomarrocanum]|uniref:SAM hydrolase/SAM-dependent halogenase family protein n=1 Tax=Vacuolonema iberomarrocanum TaxID=3454632 RepID=UPI003F6DF4B0